MLWPVKTFWVMFWPRKMMEPHTMAKIIQPRAAPARTRVAHAGVCSSAGSDGATLSHGDGGGIPADARRGGAGGGGGGMGGGHSRWRGAGVGAAVSGAPRVARSSGVAGLPRGLRGPDVGLRAPPVRSAGGWRTWSAAPAVGVGAGDRRGGDEPGARAAVTAAHRTRAPAAPRGRRACPRRTRRSASRSRSGTGPGSGAGPSTSRRAMGACGR